MNKSEVTKELKKLGRWTEAEAWKNKKIKEFREDARERAWAEMAGRFLPAKTRLQRKR